MGWSKEVGHDISVMNEDLMNDLKQNAVPSDLFNKVQGEGIRYTEGVFIRYSGKFSEK